MACLHHEIGNPDSFFASVGIFLPKSKKTGRKLVGSVIFRIFAAECAINPKSVITIKLFTL